MIAVDIAVEESLHWVDARKIRRVIRSILRDEGVGEAEISVAVVDDATIRELNRRYLKHDDATDVLSFVFERAGDWLDGEVIASAETAVACAAAFGWSAADELLLYVIHGTLHLVGYDDRSDEAAAKMRRRQRHYVAWLGLPPLDDAEPPPASKRDAESPGRSPCLSKVIP